jgi:hypothetical protein
LFCMPLGNLVEQALRADAAAVVLNLFHAPDKTELYRQCLANIAAVKAECERYAMPLMIEPLVLEPGSHGDYESSGHAGRIAALVRQAAGWAPSVVRPPSDAGSLPPGGRRAGVRAGARRRCEMVFARTWRFYARTQRNRIRTEYHPAPDPPDDAGTVAVVPAGRAWRQWRSARLTPCATRRRGAFHGLVTDPQATGSILKWSRRRRLRSSWSSGCGFRGSLAFSPCRHNLTGHGAGRRGPVCCSQAWMGLDLRYHRAGTLGVRQCLTWWRSRSGFSTGRVAVARSGR